MSYTIAYKIQGDRAKRKPLNMSKEQALRQADAAKTIVLMSGKPGYVKLFDENKNLILHTPIL